MLFLDRLTITVVQLRSASTVLPAGNSRGRSVITPSSLSGQRHSGGYLTEIVMTPSFVSAITTMTWKIGSSIITATRLRGAIPAEIIRRQTLFTLCSKRA